MVHALRWCCLFATKAILMVKIAGGAPCVPPLPASPTVLDTACTCCLAPSSVILHGPQDGHPLLTAPPGSSLGSTSLWFLLICCAVCLFIALLPAGLTYNPPQDALVPTTSDVGTVLHTCVQCCRREGCAIQANRYVLWAGNSLKRNRSEYTHFVAFPGA